MSVPKLPGLECEECVAPADLIARGRGCGEETCGGHLLCRQCFDFYESLGWVVPDATP